MIRVKVFSTLQDSGAVHTALYPLKDAVATRLKVDKSQVRVLHIVVANITSGPEIEIDGVSGLEPYYLDAVCQELSETLANFAPKSTDFPWQEIVLSIHKSTPADLIKVHKLETDRK